MFPFGGRGGRIRDTRSAAGSLRTRPARLVAEAALGLAAGPVWGFGAVVAGDLAVRGAGGPSVLRGAPCLPPTKIGPGPCGPGGP